MQNPFNPTFGDVPELFLKSSTDNEFSDILRLITNSNFARSIFITGVRGVGKTSLMMRISEELSHNDDFYIIDLINRDGILYSLLSELNVQVNSKLQRTLQSINSISFNGIEISRDIKDSNTILLLDEMMKEIKKENKKLLITLDEVTNTKPIKDLVQVFNAFKRKNYPVYLLMTGLPDLVLNLQNDAHLTFLLRSDKVEVSPLEKFDIFNT